MSKNVNKCPTLPQTSCCDKTIMSQFLTTADKIKPQKTIVFRSMAVKN